MSNDFVKNLLAQSGKTGGNILTNALALSLASHGDKAIGNALRMGGDDMHLFFGLGDPGPVGPNLAEGQTAIGIPGALAYSALNRLTDKKGTTKASGYTHRGAEPVATYAAPEGSATPYISMIKKTAEDPNSFMGGIKQMMYDNPVGVSNAIRYGTPVVGLGAAALGLHFASKPRSVYSAAVTGNPHLGETGNPSIDSARAASYFRSQEEDKKFQHAVYLRQLQAEARTPGNQGIGGVPTYGGGIAAGVPGIDMLDHASRSIYGTGLRL